MRLNRIFWGLAAIAAGVFLLLNTLGFLPPNAWVFLWPILLILTGIWFLLVPRFSRGEVEIKPYSIPLENAREAEIRLDHGAGALRLYALPGSRDLLSGSFTGGVNPLIQRAGSKVTVKLSPPSEIFIPFPHMQSLTWELGLAKEIPIALNLHTGASDSSIDLSNLQVTYLRLESGASATHITLPAKAGNTRVEIQTGAASVDLRVPEGVAARIAVESALAGIEIDAGRFPLAGGFYQSLDYETATNRADIQIKTGVGSVEVH